MEKLKCPLCKTDDLLRVETTDEFLEYDEIDKDYTQTIDKEFIESEYYCNNPDCEFRGNI